MIRQWFPPSIASTSSPNLFLLFGLIFSTAISGVLIAYNPGFAIWIIGLVGAAVYLAFTIKQPFTAFVILIFAASSEGLSRFQIISGVSVMVALGLMFSIIWLMRIVTHQIKFIWTDEYYLLIGLVAVLALSVVLNLANGVNYRRVFSYVQQIFLVVLIINMATSSIKVQILFRVFAVTSIVAALLVIAAYFNWLPEGMITVRAGGLVSAGEYQRFARGSAFFGDPNFTATQLLIGLPFLAAWWQGTTRHQLKVVFILAMTAILVALVLTFSMAGLIGLALVMYLYYVLQQRRLLILRAITGLILAGVFLTLMLSFAPETYQKRVSITTSQWSEVIAIQDSNSLLLLASNRGDTWQASWRAILQSPLLGHGPGAGSLAIGKNLIIIARDRASAHNMFLGLGVEMGLIAVAFFFGLLAVAFRYVFSNLRTKPDSILSRTDRNAIAVALISVVFMGMSLDLHIATKLLWLVIGAALAYGRVNRYALEDMPESPGSPSTLKQRGFCVEPSQL
jgi:O-antigen ligase